MQAPHAVARSVPPPTTLVTQGDATEASYERGSGTHKRTVRVRSSRQGEGKASAKGKAGTVVSTMPPAPGKDASKEETSFEYKDEDPVDSSFDGGYAARPHMPAGSEGDEGDEGDEGWRQGAWTDDDDDSGWGDEGHEGDEGDEGDVH